MKNKLTILSFMFCCIIAIGLYSCNNKPAENSETVTTDSVEENPLAGDDNYTDPVETKVDTNTIMNEGFVFLELSGKGVDGATYTVKEGDRTITQGTTANGGKFNTASLQRGKTYQVTASAPGYRSQTKSVAYSGEQVKVGLKQ